MLTSPDLNEKNKLSWLKTDISQISSLEEFPHFKLVKFYNAFFLNLYFLLLAGVKIYVNRYATNSQERRVLVQEILTYNPQKGILIGTAIGLIFTLLIIGSILDRYFSHRLYDIDVRMPRIIKKNKNLKLFYLGLKAPEIVPKGFDIIISSFITTLGLLFFILTFAINEENLSLLEWISLGIFELTLLYSLTRSVLIAFNPYAILNTTILLLVVFLPSFLGKGKIISDSFEQPLIYWLPIITLYLLPLVTSIFRKSKKQT